MQCCFLILTLCWQNNLFAQQKSDAAGSLPDTIVIRSFNRIDVLMDQGLYDSAQGWLNKIAAVLPLKQPSLSNYFLVSRQAEVYYYNGLHRLGLQEAERALQIAHTLTDSLLIADSYNFLGLFYTNLSQPGQAIQALRQGIRYTHPPPYSDHYLTLSQPHHLYANLAEAYEKNNQPDSALLFARLSLAAATQVGNQRGIAIAYSSQGMALLRLFRPAEAARAFMASSAVAMIWGFADVELINDGGLAHAANNRQSESEALECLQKGFVLLRQQPGINAFYKEKFLDAAIELYNVHRDKNLLINAQFLKTQLLQSELQHFNQQINAVLQAGLQNETRLLELQVQEARQRTVIANTRLYLLLTLLLLAGAGFILYRYSALKKLQLIRLQSKMSRDLHDDIGSSLSSLQVYSMVAENLLETRPSEARNMLQKIAAQSATAMENMGDIVWSANRHSTQSLEERIKNFAVDILSAAGIEYRIEITPATEKCLRSIVARRNILLLIKEAVNNAVKHAQPTLVEISIRLAHRRLLVEITDNGCGFPANKGNCKGAGLANMQFRTEEIGGQFHLSSAKGEGTTITATFAIPKISDSL